jgi:hypothetical protein
MLPRLSSTPLNGPNLSDTYIFQYYPTNINHSRCCEQVICSECFVQIKRTEPTVTHMVSEPACCPFCVQENFGVVYTPPPWRTGIGSEGWVRQFVLSPVHQDESFCSRSQCSGSGAIPRPTPLGQTHLRALSGHLIVASFDKGNRSGSRAMITPTPRS